MSGKYRDEKLYKFVQVIIFIMLTTGPDTPHLSFFISNFYKRGFYMSKDLMFRTSAFGGFKKDEVMDFIEKILNEKSALESQVASVNAEKAELAAQVASLQSDADELAQLRSKVAELEPLSSEVKELKAKVSECEIAMDDKDTLVKELTERLSEAKSKVDDGEVVALKLEIERLQLELSKKGDLERQVGAAMLDARVHSEELVEQAKERANNVTRAVYAAIGDTALRIDDLSAGIGEIARNFTKSVEEVELRIKALTGDMSKTAQTLISENVMAEELVVDAFRTGETVEAPKSEYDFSSPPVIEYEASFDGKIGDEDY